MQKREGENEKEWGTDLNAIGSARFDFALAWLLLEDVARHYG